MSFSSTKFSWSFVFFSFVVCMIFPQPALLHANEAEWYNGKWAHESSDLLPDPQVTFGKLSNGFRYAIIPNAQPADRVSVHLNIQVGSLMELDNELGIAHFLEHMAFNGSKNFPAGTLIPFFQKNGMSFGGDTNAHTSMLETVYKLNLVASDSDTIATGFAILSDFAHALLIEEQEVQAEKGVILAEKSARDSEAAEAARVRRQNLFAGTRFVNEVIGDEKVIKTADSRLLRDFYERWYRPERMVLVIVGQVDNEQVIPLIEKNFAHIQAKGEKPTTQAWGNLNLKPLQAFYHQRPITGTNIAITTFHPREHTADSKEQAKNTLVDAITGFAFQKRLQLREEREGGVWLSAKFTNNWRNGLLPSVNLNATTTAEKWQTPLTALNEELRTLLEYGFTQDEIDEAKDQLLEMFERQVRMVANIPNDKVASNFVQVLNKDGVYTSAEQDLDLYQELKDQLTLDNINEDLRRSFAPNNVSIYISGDAEIKGKEKDILKVWEQSKNIAIKKFEEAEKQSFPYLPLPAKIASLPKLETKSLGENSPTLYSTRLTNGLGIYFIPTSFEKNQISASLVFGGGTLSLNEEQAILAKLAGVVQAESGLGKLNKPELQRLLGKKGISVKEMHTPRNSVIAGSALTQDMDLLFKAIWTQYQDPIVLETARQKVISSLELQEHKRLKTVEGVAKNQSPSFLYGENKHFMPITAQVANEVSLANMQEFIGQTRATLPRFLIISGDFETEKALELIAQLFQETKPLLTQVENTVQPSFPYEQRKSVGVEDEVDKAIISMAWQRNLEDEQDRRARATRALVANVLRDRMREELRERMGVAYGASAAYKVSADYRGYGMFSVEVGTETAKQEQVEKAVLEIVASLVQDGIDQQELDRLRKPILTSLSTSKSKTETWHKLLQTELQLNLPYVQWHNEYPDLLASITVEDVNNEIKATFTKQKPATLLVFTSKKSKESK